MLAAAMLDSASAGVEWSGVEWSGVEWSGVEWSGVEWSGVEWSGEWSGVEWSGVEWSGVLLCTPPRTADVVSHQTTPDHIACRSFRSNFLGATGFARVFRDVTYSVRYGSGSCVVSGGCGPGRFVSVPFPTTLHQFEVLAGESPSGFESRSSHFYETAHLF
jgi:hypothetical protein